MLLAPRHCVSGRRVSLGRAHLCDYDQTDRIRCAGTRRWLAAVMRSGAWTINGSGNTPNVAACKIGDAGSCRLPSMRALGVVVRGGDLYLACMDGSGDSLLGIPVDTSPRVRLNTGLQDAQQAVDLRDRLRQDIRALRPHEIGLVQTRKFNSWKYQDAYSRVVAVTAVMYSAVELEIPYCLVKTEEIARIVGAPAPRLEQEEFSRFGFKSAPMYWTTGLAEAYGAAAALLERKET